VRYCTVDMVQCPVYLWCTLCKTRYASQSCTMELQEALATLPCVWQELFARASQSCTMPLQALATLPRDWEELFARIAIEEQKERRYAYEAQETIGGRLPRNIELKKMLENYPFRHLIAELKEGVRGMRPIHVIHHIAYGNGDETSPITKLLGRVGRTHRLYALQGLGTEAKAIELFFRSADTNYFNVPSWEELLLFTIENFDDGTFQFNWREAERISVRNGIIAIPPFMTLALTRANSSDPRVLLMAAVEAIRLVLENNRPEEDEIQQRYRLRELEYIPQWLFLASNRISDEELMEWLDVHVCDKTTCWECVTGYSIPDPDEEDDFGIGVEWLDVCDKASRGNQYAIALQDNLSWPLHFASGRGHLKDVREL
jgi:hypothetical protein